MIDTHSHIYAKEFDEDRTEAVARAVEGGVTHFILPAIDSTTHDKMFKVVDTYKNHYPTIGVHPTSINMDYRRELDVVRDILARQRERIVAIGEVGLDLYWDGTFIEQQKLALREQLDLAIANNLPAIIHTRDAYTEMIPLIADYKGSPLRAVFHSYSGTTEEAHELLSLGDHLLGIGGVVTFKKSSLGDVVRSVGLGRIVVETDAPYLAPVPRRGKRNESSYIPYIVSHLADLMGVDSVEVDEVTTNNAKKIFNI